MCVWLRRRTIVLSVLLGDDSACSQVKMFSLVCWILGQQRTLSSLSHRHDQPVDCWEWFSPSEVEPRSASMDLNVLQSAVVVDDKDVRAWFGAVSHDKSTWCNAKDSFVGF